jgi:hypothetical protein
MSFRLDTHLLDDIKDEINDRIKRVCLPAKLEYETLERTLAALNGEESMNTKQRARKRRQRHHHNNDQQHVAYLSADQVAEMQKEARRKKIGLARMMERHGYRNDGTGWRQD